MTRDEVRKMIQEAGISVSSVTKEQLFSLRELLNKHLMKSNIYDGSAKINIRGKDLRFLTMRTDDWEKREAISFNRDGFIGFSGWASDVNVKPILEATKEWVDIIIKERSA